MLASDRRSGVRKRERPRWRSDDFEGAIVVVTGASTGLGRAIAVETAQRGAAAVVDQLRLQRRRGEGHGAARWRTPAPSAVLVQADVARDEDCARIAEAAGPFGRIDALFNNAGVTKFAQNHADLDAVTGEDFLRLYGVNVVGAYQMVRAARALLEAGDAPGAVVNTSSIAGVTGIGSSVPYAASKGALTTMTLSLARALAPKIRVNAVCPGFIDTPWFGKNTDAEGLERLRQGVAAAIAAEDLSPPPRISPAPPSSSPPPPPATSPARR